MGDTGLTGRKIIVDTYGGAARHGGGAFSGKDPTKVDRSAAYAARHVAKNVVAAGLADRCELQVAYAIGIAQPFSIQVQCFGTEQIPLARIESLVREHFDLRPAAILNDLDLRRPIYVKTAAYGHFGRDEHDFTWERTDKAEALRAAAGLAVPCRNPSEMAVTVVGSVAFDALETPYGERARILGGAATHFSLAASFFTDVRVVGVVGEDFGAEELAVFEKRGVNTDDLERIPGARSFFWSGPLRRGHAGRADARHPAERVRRVRPGALGRRARLVGGLPGEHPARAAAPRARAVHGRRAGRPRLDELLDPVGPRCAARHDAHRRRGRAQRRRDPHAHRTSRT